MKRLHWIGVAALVGAAGFWLWNFLSGPPSPTGLAATALSATDAKDRINAAVELSMRKDPVGRAQLRRLVMESKDPDVIIRAVGALPALSGIENMKLCLAALANGDASVREEALVAFRRVVGVPRDIELEFNPTDPDDKRVAALKELTEKYMPPAAYAGSPPPRSIAARQPSPDSTTPTASAAPPAAPAPTPSAAPFPASAADAMPLAVPNENPTVNLLTWMCRILAAMVLLAEVAGAISLLVDGRAKEPVNDPRCKTHPPTVAEEVARILAKNSAGLWTKVALLAAGAISAVALLTTGEMIQWAARVEHRAARVEQTAVSVQQAAGRIEQTAESVQQSVGRIEQKLEKR